MARTPVVEEHLTTGSISLDLEKVGLTQDQFFQLCSDNRDFRFELTAQKELNIMPLPGPDTSWRNAIITAELTNWARKDGTGITFDCACRFILPNGASRGPDAAWLKRERWDALTPEQKRKGAPLCPEFLVELMSPSDTLAEQKEMSGANASPIGRSHQEKMKEYVANGLHLGWLIDPYNKTAYVYRSGAPPQILKNPSTLSGDPVLTGFRFNVTEIW